MARMRDEISQNLLRMLDSSSERKLDNIARDFTLSCPYAICGEGREML